MRLRTLILAGILLSVAAPRCFAPPPLVTGDVPTADPAHFEWYLGARYQDTGTIERQLPFTELVYGIMDRWEVSAEMPFISENGEYGPGDFVLGTKAVAWTETESRPGIAGSFEVKFPTGDAELGLGSGGYEYEVRLRSQKTFGWFTPILNVGYIWVPDVEVGGIQEPRENMIRASFAQEWQVASGTKLLSEIYWRTSDEAGDPDRLAWNAGFKQKVADSLTLHGAVGTSLRDDFKGGPDLRVYLGVKYEFGAPWAPKKTG